MKFLYIALLAVAPSFAQIVADSGGSSISAYLGVAPKGEIKLDGEQDTKPDLPSPIVYGVTSVDNATCNYSQFLPITVVEEVLNCTPSPTTAIGASITVPWATYFRASWIANVTQASASGVVFLTARIFATGSFVSSCYAPVIVRWATAPGTYQTPARGSVRGIVVIGIASDQFGNTLMTQKTFVSYLLGPITTYVNGPVAPCPAAVP